MRFFFFAASQAIVISLIFGLSSIPGGSFTPYKFYFPGMDKIVHACIYCGYATLTSLGLSMLLKKESLIMSVTMCVSILLGVLDEIYQQQVPGRDSSVYDCMADIVGVFIGVFLVYQILRKKK